MTFNSIATVRINVNSGCGKELEVFPADDESISLDNDVFTLRESGLYEITYNFSYDGCASSNSYAVLAVNETPVDATRRMIPDGKSSVGATYLHIAESGDTLRVLYNDTKHLEDAYLTVHIKRYKVK